MKKSQLRNLIKEQLQKLSSPINLFEQPASATTVSVHVYRITLGENPSPGINQGLDCSNSYYALFHYGNAWNFNAITTSNSQIWHDNNWSNISTGWGSGPCPSWAPNCWKKMTIASNWTANSFKHTIKYIGYMEFSNNRSIIPTCFR